MTYDAFVPGTSIARDRLVVTGAYSLALIASVLVGMYVSDLPPIWVAALADLVGTALIFEFSRRLDNSSMYDPYWSLAPVVIAAYWLFVGVGAGALMRPVIVLALLLVWAVRLTMNWVRRWNGLRDEDWRYVMLRQRYGKRYWIVSWMGIHLLPTVLVFLGCLPLYAVLVEPQTAITWMDAAAVLVTSAAIWIEARADVELHRFRTTDHEPSDILDSGLWGLCRHPNYLGEVLFWWGLFAFGLAANPSYWWTGVGALSITLLFKYVSIPMIDERMIERRPGYDERMRSTPAIIPRLRRRG